MRGPRATDRELEPRLPALRRSTSKERLGDASVTTTITLYGHMFSSVEALADALDPIYAGTPNGPANNVRRLDAVAKLA